MRRLEASRVLLASPIACSASLLALVLIGCSGGGGGTTSQDTLTERDRSAALMGSIHDALPSLGVPVTLLWGMRDRVFQPVFLDQWRELFPDAHVIELRDASHFVPEDRPDAVIEAM